MTDWKEHREMQHALYTYLLECNLTLSDNVSFESGIDCVFVLVDDDPVLIIGLPPVSNYTVRETAHTDKHLRPGKSVAV